MVKPFARPLTEKQLDNLDAKIDDLELDIRYGFLGKGGRGYGVRHNDERDTVIKKLATAKHRLARHKAAVKKKSSRRRKRRSSSRRRKCRRSSQRQRHRPWEL